MDTIISFSIENITGKTLRLLTLIFVLSIAYPVIAKNKLHRIENASDLKSWCKTKSEAYFLSKDLTPYNWSASWWDKNNTLFVKGEWRVGQKSVKIHCRVVKGASATNAVYEITGQ